MYISMKLANWILTDSRRFRRAQRLGRVVLRRFTKKDGWIHSLPGLGAKWTATRDLRGLPSQTFREWWATRPKGRP
jgi:L-lactate dehydrogenase complex protein LldF